MTYDDWFNYISIGYLGLLIAAAAAAVILWRLNDAYELGAANRPRRVYANATVLSLGMIGALASVALFVLSQRANQEAAKKTAEAQATADAARADAARAGESAAQATLELERVKTDNLKLQSDIEKQRAAQARLSSVVAPRSLTDNQRNAISAVLAAGKKERINFLILGDQEAGGYAGLLAKAFAIGGAEVSGTRVGMMAPAPYGLICSGRANSAAQLSLKAAGLDCQFIDKDVDIFEILVGLKPIESP